MNPGVGPAFFDPNDLVQVKYEMLRSVQKEGRSVVEAAQAFGLSRPVFYVTQELFQGEGLPGLLPRKRGPKRPHKLNDQAMAVLLQAIKEAGRMLKGSVLRVSVVPRAADCPDPPVREVPLWNSAAPVWLSSVKRHEVAALLASLVLATRPVVRSSREGYRSW